MSKIYTIKAVQLLPGPVERAWAFFSNPTNLEAITPDNMGFKVLNDEQTNAIYAGQIIEYRVRPVWGIPLYWMTEITHMIPLTYFVDEQRFGPYSMWHHQHHFKAVEGGVEMTDIVHYKIPFWLFGDIANALFVKKKLEGIFDFRYKKAEELFGTF